MVINMHELESRKKCLKKEELKKAGVKTTSKRKIVYGGRFLSNFRSPIKR